MYRFFKKSIVFTLLISLSVGFGILGGYGVKYIFNKQNKISIPVDNKLIVGESYDLDVLIKGINEIQIPNIIDVDEEISYIEDGILYATGFGDFSIIVKSQFDEIIFEHNFSIRFKSDLINEEIYKLDLENNVLTKESFSNVEEFSFDGVEVDETLMDELYHFTNLKKLTINNSLIKEIDLLQFNKLEVIELNNNLNMTSIENIESLTKLKRLTINNSSIIELSVGHAINLETLILTNNLKLKEVIGLSNLEELSTLTITNSVITNLNLEKNRKIKVLNIHNNMKLKTVKGLDKLENVDELDLSNTIIDNIVLSSKLRVLKVLNGRLERIFIKGVSSLENINLENGLAEKLEMDFQKNFLKTLNLTNSKYTIIDFKSDSPLLEVLNLEKTNIKELTLYEHKLTELINDKSSLENLKLKGTNETLKNVVIKNDIKGLLVIDGRLENLENLYLDNVEVDLTKLDLLNLLTFEIKNSTINDLSFLRKSLLINHIDASNSDVDRFNLDKDLVYLTNLYLNSNNIKDSKFLDYVPNIKVLDISNNDNEILELRNLDKITEININSNPLRTLTFSGVFSSLDSIIFNTTNGSDLVFEIKENTVFEKLKVIDLSNSNLKVFIISSGLPQLNKINLSNNKLTSYNFEIKTLYLDISNNNIIELSVTNSENLSELIFDNNPLSKLSFSGDFKELRKITFNTMLISYYKFEIMENSVFNRLEKIDLSNSNLTSFEIRSELDQINVINLSNNYLTVFDLNVNILDLDLSYNKLISFSLIKFDKVTSFNKVNLSNNNIHEFFYNFNLNQLKNVYLSENSLTDVYLESLERIIEINDEIFNNFENGFIINFIEIPETKKMIIELSSRIRGVKIDSNNYSLEELTIYSDGNVENIIEFGKDLYMEDLKFLSIENIKMGELSINGVFPSLEILNFDNNRISVLNFRGIYYALETLKLNSSGISKINMEADFNNLLELDLSDNELIEIDFIGEFDSLRKINLSMNQLTEFIVLEKLSSLEYLNVENNKITDIYIKNSAMNLDGIYRGTQFVNFLFDTTLKREVINYKNANYKYSINLLNVNGLKEVDLNDNFLNSFNITGDMKELNKISLRLPRQFNTFEINTTRYNLDLLKEVVLRINHSTSKVTFKGEFSNLENIYFPEKINELHLDGIFSKLTNIGMEEKHENQQASLILQGDFPSLSTLKLYRLRTLMISEANFPNMKYFDISNLYLSSISFEESLKALLTSNKLVEAKLYNNGSHYYEEFLNFNQNEILLLNEIINNNPTSEIYYYDSDLHNKYSYTRISKPTNSIELTKVLDESNQNLIILFSELKNVEISQILSINQYLINLRIYGGTANNISFKLSSSMLTNIYLSSVTLNGRSGGSIIDARSVNKLNIYTKGTVNINASLSKSNNISPTIIAKTIEINSEGFLNITSLSGMDGNNNNINGINGSNVIEGDNISLLGNGIIVLKSGSGGKGFDSEDGDHGDKGIDSGKIENRHGKPGKKGKDGGHGGRAGFAIKSISLKSKVRRLQIDNSNNGSGGNGGNGGKGGNGGNGGWYENGGNGGNGGKGGNGGNFYESFSLINTKEFFNSSDDYYIGKSLVARAGRRGVGGDPGIGGKKGWSVVGVGVSDGADGLIGEPGIDGSIIRM